MAILLMAEDGRLSYDDRLSAFFPQLPAWSAEISVHHLLHHTSGLPDYLPFFKGDEFVGRDMNGITNETVLDRATNLAAPEFPVGTRFANGGMGYVLLVDDRRHRFRPIVRRVPES